MGDEERGYDLFETPVREHYYDLFHAHLGHPVVADRHVFSENQGIIDVPRDVSGQLHLIDEYFVNDSAGLFRGTS